MKALHLGIVGVAIAATMVLGQGNQEAANLTREGIEASKAKDWDKAITAFRRAAQLDQHYAPNLASALQQRATVYVNQKKFQEAISDYSEALKIKSEEADIYERRAYAEMQLKDYDKALNDYNQAIKLSPRSIIRSARSFTRTRATLKPRWPIPRKRSNSIRVMRTRNRGKDFWMRNCTGRRRRCQCHPARFAIQTCRRRQPAPERQHRASSNEFGGHRPPLQQLAPMTRNHSAIRASSLLKED